MVLVIYAILTEQNISKLFAAAVIPGIIAMVGYMIAIAIYVRVVPGQAPEHDQAPRLTLESLKGVVPIAIIFVVVFGGIYSGLFSPTEGAGVGATMTLLVGLVKRELTLAGIRALNSLRVEKGYGAWGVEYALDYTPFEASLDRFVRMQKPNFYGKDALEKQLAAGVPHRFITAEVHGITDADPLGNEPLFCNGKMIGRATSGYFGHTIQKSLIIGYIKPEFATPGTEIEIEQSPQGGLMRRELAHKLVDGERFAAAGAPVPHRFAPRRPGDIMTMVADTRRIAAVLDWKPLYDDLDTIAVHALRWEEKLLREREGAKHQTEGE